MRKRKLHIITEAEDNFSTHVLMKFSISNACFNLTTHYDRHRPGKVLSEVKRILKPGGNFIIGIIDRETRLGKIYESMKSSNKFYSEAKFYSAEEAIKLIEKSGFTFKDACQTIFSDPDKMTAPDSVRNDYGEGAFVVINFVKST